MGRSHTGKTDPASPRHKQQSMIVIPMDSPGVTIKRMLSVYGYDHAPHGHGEILFENVRVPPPISCSAKAAVSKSPRAAWVRAESTTACV